MGLRSSIASAVDSAFVAVGDIAETITFRKRTTGSYTTSSGVVSHTDSDTSIKAIVTPRSFQQQPQGGAAYEDKNFITTEHGGALEFTIKASDITGTPDTNDQIVRDGEVYSVNQISFDPAGATYQIIGEKMG